MKTGSLLEVCIDIFSAHNDKIPYGWMVAENQQFIVYEKIPEHDALVAVNKVFCFPGGRFQLRLRASITHQNIVHRPRHVCNGGFAHLLCNIRIASVSALQRCIIAVLCLLGV